MNIKNKKWAKLPTASKSIYPVVAVHCNSKGVAFPSEETIAILSGRTPKTVREGIAGLLGYPGFTIERYITSRGRRSIKYHLKKTPDEKGRGFAFHKCIVDGGNWSFLTPSAHALYPVMRAFNFFDGDKYSELEDTEYGYHIQAMIEDGEFQKRKYNFCNADIEILAEYAGITKRSIYRALTSLKEALLTEETYPIDENDTWKIYRTPDRWDPNLLNHIAFKKFAQANERNEKRMISNEKITP